MGKRVLVGKTRVPGVIGCKAVHLQERDERTRALKHSQLYIDIGARDRDDALKAVSIGDYAVFDSDYVEFGRGFVKSRALDDRVGCAVMLELLKHDYPCNVAFAFNVQEEVGLARRHGHGLPRAAGLRHHPGGHHRQRHHRRARARGDLLRRQGPALSFMDRASIAHPGLFARMRALAQEQNIPWQLKRGTTGGNDAGSIQRSQGGVATAVVSVPCPLHSRPVLGLRALRRGKPVPLGQGLSR